MMVFFAHQGGWDEILIFAVPAALAVLALRWAERRTRDRSEAAESAGEPAETDEGRF